MALQTEAALRCLAKCLVALIALLLIFCVTRDNLPRHYQRLKIDRMGASATQQQKKGNKQVTH